MAITFNGTNISAISFNGTAIGSVKFNGTEVFDDRLVEYTFPNTTNGTDVKCTSLTGDGALGFIFKGGSGTASHEARCYHMFDNTVWAMQRKGGLGTSGSAYGIYAYAVFPPQWGKVLLKSVSVTNLNSGRYYNFSLNSTSDRTKVLDSNGNVIVNKTENGGLENSLLSFDYGTGSSAQASLASINAAAIRIFLTRRNSNTGVIDGGNYTLTFMIQKSKLKAWLDAFNLPYPDNLT